MKKYKVYFSLWNFNKAIQEPVSNIQAWVKAFAGSLATTSYLTEHNTLAFVMMVLGFAIDALLSCIYLEEKI